MIMHTEFVLVQNIRTFMSLVRLLWPIKCDYDWLEYIHIDTPMMA